MADTLTASLTASSDAAAAKAVALAETYLKPEVAASLADRLKGIRLKRASLEMDVDLPKVGALSVEVTVSVTPPG